MSTSQSACRHIAATTVPSLVTDLLTSITLCYRLLLLFSITTNILILILLLLLEQMVLLNISISMIIFAISEATFQRSSILKLVSLSLPSFDNLFVFVAHLLG